MKCEECKYFEGYDDDGNVMCEEDSCPYEAGLEESFQPGSLKIEMDATEMLSSIIHEVSKKVLADTHKIAEDMIQGIITKELQKEIIDYTRSAIADVVNAEIAKFMQNPIKVGGGWNEPIRELSREDYLSEIVSKKLGDALSKEGIARIVNDRADRQIREFTEGVKDRINRKLKEQFNDAMKEQLSMNIIQLLLANDTYQKLQQSMTNLLPEGVDVNKRIW